MRRGIYGGRVRRIEKEDGTVDWETASVHNHPNSKQNDAIGIALWFLKSQLPPPKGRGFLAEED